MRGRPRVHLISHTVTQTPQHQITQLLDRANDGDAAASEALLPLVYSELRRLAESNMANEPVGHTLQPTALVHEAYIRLLGDGDVRWDGRGHFFGAAAVAMRRILIERARRVRTDKRGGGRARADFDPQLVMAPAPGDTPASGTVDLLALDESLTRLEAEEPLHARIVMLRYFAGLTVEQTASALNLSPATIKKEWSYARAWLRRDMESGHAD